MHGYRAIAVGLILILANQASAEPTVSMNGLPLQLSWADVNGDGQQDLVALMLQRQTEGQWDTYFEDGRLHGVYEDHTYKEKYLATWIREGKGFREADHRELGQETILGFALTEGNPALPFGGTKNSGFGRYKGEAGLHAFTNVKSIIVDKDSAKIEANWYPYTPTKYQLFTQMTVNLFKGGLAGLVGFAIAGLKLEQYADKIAKQ